MFFSLISIGSKNTHLQSKNPGQNLCEALQGMGTTFIKLGQFLATRPDIIGEDMAKDLEKLNIDLDLRPDQLSSKKFLELTKLREKYG